MKPLARFAVACTALAGLLLGVASHATDVAKRPLKADLNVKPNVMFGMDDSGSMDWEILISAYNGILNWNLGNKTYWSSGAFLAKGDYYMSYLFPNGTGIGAKQFYDDESLGRAVPPSPQFAVMRSSAFNPLYYNPAITYEPWKPAYHDGALKTYANASPTAAKSHPALAASVTMDLTADQTATIYYRTGMLRPNGTVGNNSANVATTYYPATYWVVDPSCPDNTPAWNAVTDWNASCVKAPDDRMLRKVEIKRANYADDASHAAALQNFANWWSYYRKRKLMLAGAMGSVLDNLTGMRVGVMAFNRRSGNVSMYDSDATDDAANRRRVAGSFYTNPADSGTPTATALKYIGEQYKTSPNAIQYSCQRNNAFVVTDGFANDTAAPPAYDKATYGTGFPFAPTKANSIADVALAYYTLDLRNNRPTSGAGYPLSSGRVPLANQAVANPDRNPNLHMNTYVITLGVKGTVWPSITDPFTTTFTWPDPQPDTPSAIDDLWHATINGRGQMYKADDPTQAARAIQQGLNDMLNQLGAQSDVSVNTVNLARGDGKAYLGKYTSSIWTGDITANAINTNTGSITATPTWSAAQRLAVRPADRPRVIATSVGGVRKAFTADNVGATLSATDGAGLTAYLRGDRTGEGTKYRTRGALIGPVLSAKPVVSTSPKVVFAASGEGMMHAFDSETGDELWAYVPGSVLPNMARTARLNYYFETLLDGTPTIRTVAGKRYLVAGLGSGGAGYYAIDVSEPRDLTETGLASKVLWDIGHGGDFVLGQSLGRPLLVETRSYGTVVLFTQGYNGSTDGKGRMYMVNADNGALLHTFVADGGGTGDLGLAQINAAVEGDGKSVHVYGGDLQGNLWHFDLEAKTTVRLAKLLKNSTAQPVTTAPEIMFNGSDRIVLVGTGRMLGSSDFGRASAETFYAIKEGAELADARAGLTQRTLQTQSDGTVDAVGSSFTWTSSRGWYVDIPGNLQVTTDPTIAFGAVSFVANKTLVSECTGNSTLFVLDVLTGLNVKGMNFAAMSLGQTSSSGVTLLRTSGDLGDRIVAQFQRGDGTSPEPPQEVPLNFGVDNRKNAWRQIRRGDNN
ncbi:MAG: pilus assembly protein [Aquincola tertiaricarbonis]